MGANGALGPGTHVKATDLHREREDGVSGKQQQDHPRAIGRETEFDIDAAKAASKQFKLLRATIEKLGERGQKKADAGLREADFAYKVAHVWFDHAEAAISAGAATKNEWRRYATTETAKEFGIGPRRVQQLVSYKRARMLTPSCRGHGGPAHGPHSALRRLITACLVVYRSMLLRLLDS